jgi:hypothetical protein
MMTAIISPRRIRMITQMAVVGGIVAAIGSATELGAEGEFSPFTLELRGRSVLYIAGIPVCRSGWTRDHESVADFLVTAGYWAPVAAADPHWIQMGSFHGRTIGSTPFGAAFRRNDWVGWSTAHPELARRLWPYVLKLLRGPPRDYAGMTLVRPEDIAGALLREAHNATDVADLQRDLDLFDRLTTPAGDKGKG